ncbi:MAG: cytochrome c oxidase subunit 3 family protein [Candidatus Acidiferrales bacterium]
MSELASTGMPSSGGHAAGVSVPGLRHHFEDAEQQREAGTLGMWVFLATEILFFGGLFAGYAIYRSLYLPGFEAGSRLLNGALGATNTAVLIGSSLTMAMAVHSAQTGKRKALVAYLIVTMILGAAFLGIKYHEWAHHWDVSLVPGLRFAPTEAIPGNAPLGSVEMFFCFYFFMTGLHALHMIIGLGIMTVMTVMAWRGKFSPEYYTPIEVSGLYWHLVDIVWIFLFPLLYLIGGRY